MTTEPPSQDPPLDAEEAARWWRTAVAHRQAAETLAATGAFPGAVLLVDQAGQCQLEAAVVAAWESLLAPAHTPPEDEHADEGES